MKKDIDYSFTVLDDDGYTWYWDGSRIYALDVEDPEADNDVTYIDVGFIHRKGYEAKTWKEALNWLVTDGYISNEEAQWQDSLYQPGQEYKDWFDPKESYLPDY
jgi:hypothetical protein